MFTFLLSCLCLLGYVSATCDLVCTKIYDPVCAYSPSEGVKNFNNPCLMDVQNKCYNGSFSIKHEGVCGEVVKYSKSCKFLCEMEDEPVCGYDCKNRKNFTSSCALDQENVCAGKGYFINNEGSCKPVQSADCSRLCSDIYQPVCGFDRCNGYKSFSSPCRLTIHNLCYLTDYKNVGGGCDDGNSRLKVVQSIKDLEYKH